MKRTDTRLENLERAVGGEDVMVVKWEHKDFVTFSLPPEKRGERMSFADFQREFPGATIVQLKWEDGEEYQKRRT